MVSVIRKNSCNSCNMKTKSFIARRAFIGRLRPFISRAAAFIARRATCLLALLLLLLPCGCQKYDDSALREELNSHAQRIAALEATVNSNTTALQELVRALQNQRYITDVSELTTEPGGWIISFNTGSPITITISNGEKGDTGDTGQPPQIGVAQFPEGSGTYYWTLNSDFITDNGTPDGNKMPVTGDKGDTGKTPKVAIGSDNYWYVSADGTAHGTPPDGTGWTNTGVEATGPQGDAIFATDGVDNTHADYVEFTLADNITKIQVPKYKSLGITFTQPAGFPPLGVQTVPFTLTGDVQLLKVIDVPQGWSVKVNRVDNAGAFTITASAEPEEGTGEAVILISDGAERTIPRTLYLPVLEPAESGATGACTWALYGASGNYTLAISGSGAMGGYMFSNMPWDSYRSGIKTVVIQDGVTAIGESAFSGCSGLTEVTIGNSVTTIASYAFYDCSGLKAVTIPNSVETIGEWAFSGCTGLTAINVGADNQTYSSIDGVLCNKDQTTLITCPPGKTGSYAIPNSVTTIGERAFLVCSGLTEVIIPNSVTTIGVDAFYHCTGLKAVTIGNSVTTIDWWAFDSCFSIPTWKLSVRQFTIFIR